jgi:hypothetical protein
MVFTVGIVVAFGMAFTLVSLKYLAVPYAWIAFFWATVLLSAAKFSKKSSIKAVWFNVAVGIVTLGGFETYLGIEDRSNRSGVENRFEGSYVNEEYYQKENKILGYAPVKGASVNSRKYHREELIYDVTYTIDSGGLRISPPFDPTSNNGCILFFGGSFTFGEGVNDDQTMPYRVGIYSKGRYRVHNLGFHGYGPHQMLSALEHGLVENTIDCEPKYIIYQALDRHVLRSSGNVDWGQNSPRYVLKNSGEVVLSGTFEDRRVTEVLILKLKRQLEKSFVYKKSIGVRSSDEDVKLYAEIVNSARKYVESHYPKAEFHVLLWHFHDRLFERVYNELKFRELNVHLVVEDILPPAGYNAVFD